eukprot:CAMPEP_0202731034 /NCGR_PEP_ID=MMETSP1385-20130828/186943_1 /ASSEMBLY_ACC=CAM_ASM_000861 /TAXON_ID=933848 /ORGANISM="Elphidium margaritaceum" /LENGTH=743 /DNA_ID=CAMNT_0049397317 /DNA_START=44 /DNA_END=2275 /DNA_ORIENTATION=-
MYVNTPHANWPVYLFGDNDIDNSRPPNTEREMLGGLANVAGQYDRTIAFGIVTTFYAYKPMPDFTKFKDIINRQFEVLCKQYVQQGHDLIVPCPNNFDLKRHFHSFFQQLSSNAVDATPQYQQVIFHNIGTGIARLPLLYLKYIQYKLDVIDKMATQHNDSQASQSIAQPMAIAPSKMDHVKPASPSSSAKPMSMVEFSANDVIEVCVNAADTNNVWRDAVFLGYSDKNKNKCFIEILSAVHNNNNNNNHNHNHNQFLEQPVSQIRFKHNEFMRADSDPNDKAAAAAIVVQHDEWENVSDFVLQEYIRDVSDELSNNLLSSLDEFMRRMAFLGVYSAQSRSRALMILEDMKNSRASQQLALELEQKEKDANVAYQKQMASQSDALLAAEMAQKIADGHTLETFLCCACQKTQEYGGIELRNCAHRMCYACFPSLVSSHIAASTIPKCVRCGMDIHQTDIKVHVDAHTADVVSDLQIKDMMSKQTDLHTCMAVNCQGCIIIEGSYMKEFACPECGERNCLKCKKIHFGNEQCYVPPPPPKPRPRPIKHRHGHGHGGVNVMNTGNYHMSNEEFINHWVNLTDIKSSTMIEVFDVPYHGAEWLTVCKHIRDPNKRHVERIQRIQNAKVWRAFWAYCQGQKQGNMHGTKVGGFWHGTRTHKPDVIWKSTGFLVSKSRIGNCLWYATENIYSMGGFQHSLPDGRQQVFLAFVCCGNHNDVKFIRNNQILNVYKDAATYPAYLLTYKNV